MGWHLLLGVLVGYAHERTRLDMNTNNSDSEGKIHTAYAFDYKIDVPDALKLDASMQQIIKAKEEKINQAFQKISENPAAKQLYQAHLNVKALLKNTALEKKLCKEVNSIHQHANAMHIGSERPTKEKITNLDYRLKIVKKELSRQHKREVKYHMKYLSGTAGTMFCAHCQKSGLDISIKLKKCARCETVNYCNTNCQKADWKQHQPSCKKPDHTK